jgi:hypothetical protein
MSVTTDATDPNIVALAVKWLDSTERATEPLLAEANRSIQFSDSIS